MDLTKELKSLFNKSTPNKFRKRCELIVIRDSKIMCGYVGKGRLILPGGGVDDGESFKQAARRETVEETGVQVSDIKQLHTKPIVLDYYQAAKLGDTLAKYKLNTMKKYRGEETIFLRANYVERDKEDLHKEEWYMKKLIFVRPEHLINFYGKKLQLLQESKPKLAPVFDKYYKQRIHLLERLKND